jgi:tetratricopeptide (TPR) repeat protein
MRNRSLSVVLVVLAAAPGLLSGQFPPEKLTNLKVFPADMPVRALIDTMAGFTRALGVRCPYCHVGQEGQPLSTFDFASDEKPAKEKSRQMLRMVADINGEHLAKLADRRDPPIPVTCMTCHRGVSEPRPLQQVVVAAYDRGGPDSAEATYRALRQRYHGRAAYDFGETSLAGVGAELRRRGKLADAVRFHRLNMEMLPSSGFAHRQAADAQLATGDTAAARTTLQRALAIDSTDAQARRALDAIPPK